MKGLRGVRLIVAGLVVGLWASPTVDAAEPSPQRRTDQLLWECEGRGEVGKAGILYCAGYLGGFNDLNALYKHMTGASLFCPPLTGVSNDQLRLIFIKWARSHPEELHKTARVSVLFALREAFPCAALP